VVQLCLPISALVSRSLVFETPRVHLSALTFPLRLGRTRAPGSSVDGWKLDPEKHLTELQKSRGSEIFWLVSRFMSRGTPYAARITTTRRRYKTLQGMEPWIEKKVRTTPGNHVRKKGGRGGVDPFVEMCVVGGSKWESPQPEPFGFIPVIDVCLT
jgi:hypothetical protein